MGSISPRAAFFGDTFSRPASRASSTTTEIHGSTRSLVREVDHIKALISRTTLSSKPLETSITAQVFRRGPQQDITQAQILHELDALRRRLKYETSKPLLEPELEDVDPETETDEDDFHDAIDGYDDDLDTVQEQIKRADDQKESMIEEAEARVDRLTDENDHLQSTLKILRHDLDVANRLVNDLEHNRAAQNDVVARLTATHAETVKSLEDDNSRLREHDSASLRLQGKSKDITIAQGDVEEYKARLADLQSQLQQQEQSSKAALARTQDEHAMEIQQLRETSEQKLSAMDRRTMEETSRQQADHGAALSSAADRHAQTVAETNARHAERERESKASYEKRLSELKAEMQTVVTQSNSTHTATVDTISTDHGNALALLKAQHTAAVDGLKDQIELAEREHSKTLSDLRRDLGKQVEDRNEHERQLKDALADANSRLETSKAELEMTKRAHGEEKTSLRTSLVQEWSNKLDKAAADHSAVIATLQQQKKDAELASASLLEQTKKDHQNEIEVKAQQHAAEQSTAAQVADRKLTEEKEMYEKQIEELKAQHAAILSQNDQRTQQAVDDALARESHQNTERPHELNILEKLHAKEQEKEFSAVLSSDGLPEPKVENLMAAIAEQQAAQRHLEEMLQEKTHEAIQAIEERKSRERNIIVLEQQLKALSDKHEKTEHTLRELQDTVLEHQALASGEAAIVDGELGRLRQQVSDAQAVKSSVESDIDAKINERAELARQNDFLTTQLAALGEQMNQPVQRQNSYTEKGVQTTSRIEVIGSPKRAGHKRNTSLSMDTATQQQYSPTRSKRSSLVFGPELRHDTPASPLSRQMSRMDDRPSTPLSPDYRPKRWSLQDYVDRTDAEEDELPSTITASEALLAQKFREHANDLQQARDRLARQYQERFDSLLVDRKRLEKQITLEQATDFVREREQLAAKFLRSEQQAISQSVAKQEMRNAEQHLVRQYHKSLAKRKSQIRLKHADDFHNLTTDYDKHLQDLLMHQSELENGLFENWQQDEKRIDFRPDSRNALLRVESNGSEDSLPITVVAAKESTSRLPRRSLLSTPRSSSSIPRIVSPSGTRTTPETPTQPSLSRRSSGNISTHPPVRQRSLLRMKSPSELTTKRSMTDLSAPEQAAPSSLLNEGPGDDSVGDAASIESQGKGLKRQPGSPNIKASLDVKRIPSSSSLSQRSVSSIDRSKRHSSGLIYNKLRGAAPS